MSMSQETMWWPFKPPGGDGGGTPPTPKLAVTPSPAARRVDPGEKAAKEDLITRLKRARSRALSQIAEVGLLQETPSVARPVLSDVLG